MIIAIPFRGLPPNKICNKIASQISLELSLCPASGALAFVGAAVCGGPFLAPSRSSDD